MKINHKGPVLAFALTIALFSGKSEAQTTGGTSVLDLFQDRSFVENQGQFDQRLDADPIRFGFEGPGQQVFLADHKVYFNLYHARERAITEEEEEAREKRKRQGFDSPEAYTAWQKAGHRLDYTTDLLVAEWVGANPAVELIAQEIDPFTHTYEIKEGRSLTSKAGIPSCRKVTYRNLYPHIDVEYVLHPQSGVKYSLILHPGADLSQVKLRYSKSPALQPDGSITTRTRLGEVTDHPPVTFYQGSHTPIASAYQVQGNDITFSLASYNPAQTVVIDPWTDLPNDPGSNWNSAWECETDALGNSYAIFGAMPMRLRKYNAAGAIQWTYNTTYDTTAWLGTFVTDDLGNSYVTNGSVAALRKVSPAGGLLWSVGNITGQLLGEFWNIAFNCDQTRLITGGTGGAFNPIPYIFEVNTANGALLGSVQVHQGTGLFSPSEVRAITATENAKYYWLSHDSIGFLSQSFSACPNPGSELIANNTYDLGYKCENWRYNNTGIEAIAYHSGFVYVNRGNRLDKRNAATAAIVASVAIPGGGFTSQFGGNFVENSGIVIDNNGRIFVGSRGSVSQFNTALTLIGTYPVTGGYNVYDVDLTSTGEVIACGSSGNSGSASRTGTVESLGVLGAGPYVMPCCDASICAVGPLCDTDLPVTLQSSVGGGTWSSSAPGFNAATGVFDPVVAGIGTYTFYNTVACGIDSVVIDVVFCPGLSVCRLPNGDLSVSGGTGPYTWEQGTMVASCPFGPGAGCNFLTHHVSTLTWTNLGTGTTITPPPGADTIRVFDATLDYTSWDIASLPVCGVLPVELVLFDGESIGERTNSLVWVSASETNCHHYTVQSSPDGVHYSLVGTVAAEGFTSNESTYRLLDRKAHHPVTWYRLGETDLNGDYRPLSTIAVYSDRDESFIFEVHPIPASDRVNFTYTGASTEQTPLRVRLVNNLGAVLIEKSYSSLAHNSLLSLDVSSLAEGVYEMCFQLGTRAAYRKVLILRAD